MFSLAASPTAYPPMPPAPTTAMLIFLLAEAPGLPIEKRGRVRAPAASADVLMNVRRRDSRLSGMGDLHRGLVVSMGF